MINLLFEATVGRRIADVIATPRHVPRGASCTPTDFRRGERQVTVRAEVLDDEDRVADRTEAITGCILKRWYGTAPPDDKPPIGSDRCDTPIVPRLE